MTTPLEDWLNDLWETCDFPRPTEPSEHMKRARLRAKEQERTIQEVVAESANYGDKRDSQHFRHVTNEIRKVRGERASDKNIEWALNRAEPEPERISPITKLTKSPQKIQTNVVDPENFQYHFEEGPKSVNIKSSKEFPTLK